MFKRTICVSAYVCVLSLYTLGTLALCAGVFYVLSYFFRDVSAAAAPIIGIVTGGILVIGSLALLYPAYRLTYGYIRGCRIWSKEWCWNDDVRLLRELTAECAGALFAHLALALGTVLLAMPLCMLAGPYAIPVWLPVLSSALALLAMCAVGAHVRETWGSEPTICHSVDMYDTFVECIKKAQNQS